MRAPGVREEPCASGSCGACREKLAPRNLLLDSHQSQHGPQGHFVVAVGFCLLKTILNQINSEFQFYVISTLHHSHFTKALKILARGQPPPAMGNKVLEGWSI